MAKSNILKDILLRSRNKKMNAQKLKTYPGGIYRAEYVEIGGIQQWVTVRGKKMGNPILLFVHGGPGSPYSMFNPLISYWEEHFTVVQWDQRGSGKTYRKNKKNYQDTMTFNQIANDGIELVEYLCSTLKQKKIVLIGSSLGSLIGMLMIKEGPDLFFAYVVKDQNGQDTKFETCEVLRQALNEKKDKKRVLLLEKMGKDPRYWNREDFDKLNQHLVHSIEQVPNMIMDLMHPSMISSPEHTIKEIFDIFK